MTLPVALQVSIPLWALVHLPVVVTITTAVFTPKGWLHCILYVLFENAMGIVKLWAVIAGLLSATLHPSFTCLPLSWPAEGEASDLGQGFGCHLLMQKMGLVVPCLILGSISPLKWLKRSIKTSGPHNLTWSRSKDRSLVNAEGGRGGAQACWI